MRPRRPTGEVLSQKRGGDRGRKGEEENQRMGTSWEKKIWRSLGAEIVTFSLKSHLIMYLNCRTSLFLLFCSLSYCKLI